MCPYLFEKSTNSNVFNSGLEGTTILPIDESGACLFHSEDIAWKRKNNFVSYLTKLVLLTESDKSLNVYDFTEFRVVGNDLRSKNNEQYYVFSLNDIIFTKEVKFSHSIFFDAVELDRINFKQGGCFGNTNFIGDVKVNNSCFEGGVNFGSSKFSRIAIFKGIEFKGYALFDNVEFVGNSSGYTLKFQDSEFCGMTDFTNAIFVSEGNDSTVGFSNVRFKNSTDFSDARFGNQVVFEDTSFEDVTDFIDTRFETTKSSARYAGSAVEFNRIEVMALGVLTFKSTDSKRKIFNHNVQISFNNDPLGIIEFENVNYTKIDKASRDRLARLEKLGNVTIGIGCIRYRFQTEPILIQIDQGNSALIIDLCQTFTNYFTASNGCNLGFEILDRNDKEVQFFYFTDEDISEKEFYDRLSNTEQDLWHLLSPNALHESATLENHNTVQTKATRRAIVNAVDGVSALLMNLFRVGTRISLGLWEERDTNSLVNSIKFGNNETVQAQALHEVIVTNYTGGNLVILNQKQNSQIQFINNSITVDGDKNTVISNSTVK